LYFKSDTWSEEEEKEYYGLQDPTRWETSGLFPTERAILQVVRRLPAGSAVLDFGCSTGRLLFALGNEYRRFGVEVNEPAAAVARSRGVEVAGLEEFEATRPQGFRALVLSDVFEHLRHPTSLLQRLDRLLAPGGLLILGTGRADATACQRDIAGFWYFQNVEHLTMLGHRYGRHLESALGYRIEDWRTLCHYDIGWSDCAMQHVRDFAYRSFRKGGLAASVLRWVPVVNRARDWPAPPALKCTADHVVFSLRKP
jgi:SAM-dependent methyltransferase